MGWGDVPAWGALGLSAVAVAISLKARGDGKRSADASQSSADASQRSADAAEASLTLQSEDAEARRLAAMPRPVFKVTYAGNREYKLWNFGEVGAFGLRVHAPFRVNDGGNLQPGYELDFVVPESMNPPDEVVARFDAPDGRSEFAFLPLPPMYDET